MNKFLILEKSDWKNDWDKNILKFEDFDYKQSSAFASTKSRFSKYLRFVLLSNNIPVIFMQARVIKLPLRSALIFVRGGPIFIKETDSDTNRKKLILFFSELQKYLGKEFSFFYLNILCNTEFNKNLEFNFYESGLKKPTFQRLLFFTYIVPIASDPEINFKNFDSKWRNQLRKSLSYDPTYNFGSDDKLIMQFLSIYDQMHKIKSLNIDYDVTFSKLKSLSNNLHGFNILILSINNEPVCGCVVFIFGKKAYYHLAASNFEGRKKLTSNAMIWFLIKKLSDLNITELDLVGVDPVNNWGSYHFKKGIGGNLKLAMGEWEMASNRFFRTIFNALLYAKVHFRLRNKKD